MPSTNDAPQATPAGGGGSGSGGGVAASAVVSDDALLAAELAAVEAPHASVTILIADAAGNGQVECVVECVERPLAGMLAH